MLTAELPALEDEFQMPKQASDQDRLTAGRKFARDAEPFKGDFIAHGMATTFVADLEALVDDLERALRERGMGRDERGAAKANIKAALSSGVNAVRALDVIVANHLRHDEVTKTVWDHDCRIVYPQSASATAAAVPESTQTAAAASASAVSA